MSIKFSQEFRCVAPLKIMLSYKGQSSHPNQKLKPLIVSSVNKI